METEKRPHPTTSSYKFSKHPLKNPSIKPTKRDGSAYCIFNNKIYIFGGAMFDEKIPIPIESNDFWSFDLGSFEFEQIKGKVGASAGACDDPTATGDTVDAMASKWPGTRASSALAGAKVGEKNYIYLFGGITEKSGWLDDLWRFDIENCIWKEIDVNVISQYRPSSRSMHSLTTTSRSGEDQILLFGGFGPEPEVLSTAADNLDISGNQDGDWEDVDGNESDKNDIKTAQASQQAFKLTRFNDTFLFNPASNSWTCLVPEDESKVPSRRAAHKIVSLNNEDKNNQNNICILFGGKGDQTRLGDIWKFDVDLLQWNLVQSESDSKNKNQITARSFHELCVSKDNRVYLHVAATTKTITYQSFKKFTQIVQSKQKLKLISHWARICFSPIRMKNF